MRLVWYCIIVIIFCGSCRPKYNPKPVACVFNNFENVNGWIDCFSNNVQTVVEENKNPINYAIRVDSVQRFGYLFKKPLRELSQNPISWVKISAKVKVLSPGLKFTVLVCNVSDSLNNILKWESLNLFDQVLHTRGKWVQVQYSVPVYTVNNKNNYISVFPWASRGFESVLVDDLKVEFFN